MRDAAIVYTVSRRGWWAYASVATLWHIWMRQADRRHVCAIKDL